MGTNKRILVAPLNWGLGHATRCMPIIQALLDEDFEPIIASDGAALQLLNKEFPEVKSVELPSYNISYAKSARHFKIKIITDAPGLLKTIKKEKKIVKDLVETLNISGIISDNRFGVRSKKVPSVFITHQLRVLSGNTTWLSSKMHQNIISKFTECWVPDVEGRKNLSGKLGHVDHLNITLKYIGPLSRFNKSVSKTEYDLLVLLSGPEPQRTMLEKQLLVELQNYSGKVLFVRGKMEAAKQIENQNLVTIHNYMTSEELENAINKSNLILSRSGYTTIMDLAKLEKKAFFIPTPGQFEQEYLAEKFYEEGVAPFCNQDDFKINKLDEVNHYTGFRTITQTVDIKELFSLF